MGKISPFTDEQALTEYVFENIMEHVPMVQLTSFGAVAPCPICGDSKKGNKKRFQYYRESFSAFCFNAGCPLSTHGAAGLYLTSLLKNVDKKTENVDYMRWYQKNVSKDISFDEKPADTVEPESESKEQERSVEKPLPVFEDSWIELPKIVYDYCDKRKLFSAPFAPPQWQLYYDVATKRLVIPWYENGNIVYWQKRALINGDEPKYLYQPGTERPVFGIDRIDSEFPYIFMVEGALDSIFVYNCVAIGGIQPSHQQLSALVERYPMHELVTMLDNQWRDKSAKIMLKGDYLTGTKGLISTQRNRKFFIWPKGCPYKDVNECCCNNEHGLFKFHDPKWMLRFTMGAMQAKVTLAR